MAGVVQIIGEFLEVTPRLLGTHRDHWGEFEGGFWRKHGRETALGRLGGGFLSDVSSGVNTFGGY